MEKSVAIVVADVDVLTVEYLSDLLERHGFSVRIAPPVLAAVGDWIHRYGAEVCMVDVALRDGVDLAGLAWLHREYPDTSIIVRTAENSPETMRAALEAGACGYIHKSRGPVVLVEAVRRVLDGEIVVEGSFARAATSTSDDQAEFSRLVATLTPRQYECLELLAEGKGTVAMAEQLGVSVMTVRSHVQALLGKLGVRSRLEAASLMVRSLAGTAHRDGSGHLLDRDLSAS